jgi:hypothetical protein
MGRQYREANPYKWVGQPATAQGVVPASAGFIPTTQPLLFAAWLQNRGAGAVPVALISLIPDSKWEAGQWVNATTTYTPDTADAQDADTNDFALETTTVNDGHVIGCDEKFGAIGYDISTASIGAGQVHVVEYWNGSAWTAIAATGMLVDIPRAAGVTWTINEFLVLFDPKSDWAKGGSGTGVNQNRYNLRIRATTAPTTAGLAKRIYIGQVLASQDALGANLEFTRNWQPTGLILPEWVAAIGSAFGTADESNTLELVRS